VLLGALLGYGWASRQPTLYEGVARVRMADPCADFLLGVPLCMALTHTFTARRS
jgi:hypothetical protein